MTINNKTIFCQFIVLSWQKFLTCYHKDVCDFIFHLYNHHGFYRHHFFEYYIYNYSDYQQITLQVSKFNGQYQSKTFLFLFN